LQQLQKTVRATFLDSDLDFAERIMTGMTIRQRKIYKMTKETHQLNEMNQRKIREAGEPESCPMKQMSKLTALVDFE
jgi:hypothetical protein